jgi:hypothetical protein
MLRRLQVGLCVFEVNSTMLTLDFGPTDNPHSFALQATMKRAAHDLAVLQRRTDMERTAQRHHRQWAWLGSLSNIGRELQCSSHSEKAVVVKRSS